ncbi:hypothetical protein GGF37_002306 [Kickxella alabastrina]|nr:hypothetical protein GGF37_002306 [Kickxella alabastrina]
MQHGLKYTCAQADIMRRNLNSSSAEADTLRCSLKNTCAEMDTVHNNLAAANSTINTPRCNIATARALSGQPCISSKAPRSKVAALRCVFEATDKQADAGHNGAIAMTGLATPSGATPDMTSSHMEAFCEKLVVKCPELFALLQ